MILREAAQHADSGSRTSKSSGLSLEQIKSAAAEAGIDPARVERAALRISQQASESFFERAVGGPIRHRHAIDLPAERSNELSARLLSAIRAATTLRGEGNADAAGLSWHARQGGNDLSVMIHEDSRGTHVQILVDRTKSLVVRLYLSSIAIVMPAWTLIESIDSYPEVVALFALPVGVLAVARAFWKSSTRSIRARTVVLLETLREAVHTPDDKGGTRDGNA